ncbi:MAG TPA: hypothetical protein VFP49_11235 [Nitrososphaeraceae archaeon]|nr:hypothetical protein [Nitrososphaeraceae archaeon]
MSFSNNVIIFFSTHNNILLLYQQYHLLTPEKPEKEGNSRNRKCGMCCFGDSYYIRSKKEYERSLLFAVIESQQQ